MYDSTLLKRWSDLLALTGAFNGRGRSSKQTGGNTVCLSVWSATPVTAEGRRRRKLTFCRGVNKIVQIYSADYWMSCTCWEVLVELNLVCWFDWFFFFFFFRLCVDNVKLVPSDNSNMQMYRYHQFDSKCSILMYFLVKGKVCHLHSCVFMAFLA